MLILQAFFLWLIVSALMIGGAMLFHRRFPEESPWLGFIVPPLAFVLLVNFIEHLIALPVLLYLLPLFLGATVWMIIAGRGFKRVLILPSAVFLVSFAFTFLIRCLRPDIDYTSDGISDLNMINNFSQGQTLPPPDTWLPPLRYEWYYDMQHYAASVLERLLNVKIGVAYNVSHALLSALICVVGAGVAHRISGGRIFATLAVPFLLEAAATGSSAYVYLSAGRPDPDLWMAVDLGTNVAHPPNAAPIWSWLREGLSPQLAAMGPDDLLNHQTLRLQVPGFWTWRSEYHANASGHLLTLLAMLAVVELMVERRTIWPWVLTALTPLLATVTSAWALPITALVCWVMLPVAWLCGRRPASVRMLAWTLFGSLMVLWPAFYASTSAPEFPTIDWIDPLDRVPLREFLLQWWPVILLWLCGIVCVRQLPVSLRWFLVVVPVMLIGIELVTIQSRYNMIEKMWGYTWAVGFFGLFPFVASRKGLVFRAITLVLICSSFVSLAYFIRDVMLPTWDGAAFKLEGTQYLMGDEQKKRIFEIVGQTKHATYLSGKCIFCYNEPPAVVTFTKNKAYVAWSNFEYLTNTHNEPLYREGLNNDFYSGKMTNRLQFLQSHDIEGVIIWPDDDISSDDLGKMRADLEPAYEYIDCKGSGEKNAGVFVRRPLARG